MLIRPKEVPGTRLPSIDEIAKVNDGARMANMLPFMKSEIEQLMGVVQTRIYIAISHGELTPEMAVTAWHEMAAYRNLLKRYQTRVSVGEGVAQKHTESFTIGE